MTVEWYQTKQALTANDNCFCGKQQCCTSSKLSTDQAGSCICSDFILLMMLLSYCWQLMAC